MRENVGSDGNLDTDRVARALLGYRNTPNVELKRSPAQLLYRRNLRDHLPGTKEVYVQRKEWLMIQREREIALAEKYGKIKEDREKGTKRLRSLSVGDNVMIQEQKGSEPLRWKRSGIVVEKKEYDQYVVRMDGSGRTTLRNRKFLRRIEPLHQRDPLGESEAELEREHVRRSTRQRAEIDRYQAGG